MKYIIFTSYIPNDFKLTMNLFTMVYFGRLFTAIVKAWSDRNILSFNRFSQNKLSKFFEEDNLQFKFLKKTIGFAQKLIYTRLQ